MLCAELEIGANFSKSKSNFFCDNNWFLIHPLLLQLLVGQKNEKQRKTKQNKQRSKKQKT